MKTPEAMKPVLAWDGHQWVRAMWVPKFTERAAFNNDWCEYNESDDTYYLPEGWYELQSHSSNELVWHIHCGVTEWRELPPPPGEVEVQEPVSKAVKINRQAQAMYAKHPTYKGATPMTWDEAPLAVKREWIEKAREISAPAAQPAPELACDRCNDVLTEGNAGVRANCLPAYQRQPLTAWQPIETAPRDETRVLLFDPMRDPKEMIGRWRGDAWWGDPTPSGRSTTWRDESGSYWMPLPDAPSALGITEVKP